MPLLSKVPLVINEASENLLENHFGIFADLKIMIKKEVRAKESTGIFVASHRPDNETNLRLSQSLEHPYQNACRDVAEARWALHCRDTKGHRCQTSL
jgi:hypothetical protein